MRMLPALLLLSSAASAQTSRWASAGDKTAVWMISQERRWAETACDGNDVVQTLLADDFQGTTPSGKRYSKPTTPEKPSARDCKLGEVKIRFFGDNLAIAYGSESRVNLEGRQGSGRDPHLDRHLAQAQRTVADHRGRGSHRGTVAAWTTRSGPGW
jgi:hypothetical protein